MNAQVKVIFFEFRNNDIVDHSLAILICQNRPHTPGRLNSELLVVLLRELNQAYLSNFLNHRHRHRDDDAFRAIRGLPIGADA